MNPGERGWEWEPRAWRVHVAWAFQLPCMPLPGSDLSSSLRASHGKQILTHWLGAWPPVVTSITLSSGLLGTGLTLFPDTGPILQRPHLFCHSVLLLVFPSPVLLTVYRMSIPTPPLSWASLSLQATLSHRGKPGHAQWPRRPNHCPVWEGKCLLSWPAPSL